MDAADRGRLSGGNGVTGHAALAQLEGNDIDLVVLDLQLPDMSGLDICRRVRRRLGGIYLPILLVTGLDGEAEREEGFAAGADDYITKPFRSHELLSRVRVWSQTRQRFAAYQHRLHTQARALQEAERRELTAQLDGIKLAARELTDLINNSLAVAKSTLELVETETQVPTRCKLWRRTRWPPRLVKTYCSGAERVVDTAAAAAASTATAAPIRAKVRRIRMWA